MLAGRTSLVVSLIAGGACSPGAPSPSRSDPPQLQPVAPTSLPSPPPDNSPGPTPPEGFPFPLVTVAASPAPVGAGVVQGVRVEPTPTAPPPGAATARAEAASSLTGQVRDDVASMLAAGERAGPEAERYATYRGAWQYLRNEYFRAGQPQRIKTALDAIEATARTFPQYQSGDFELRAP